MTSTIGHLCANDIGSTEISVRHEGATISGILTVLQIEAERHQVRQWGSREPERDAWVVTLTITIGSITLSGLPRDHPMEVIS